MSVKQVIKFKHKELKKKVTIAEAVRDNDRSHKTWKDVHTLKKEKLQAKDKLNETKQ